jgi:predicted nucleotidyltransferase component of viral defense system
MKMAFGIVNSIIKKRKEIITLDSLNRKMGIEDIRHYADLLNTDDLVRIEKDYFQELILYLLSSNPGIVLKGGAALRKFWDAERFSADLDFVGDFSINVLDDLIAKLNQRGYSARIGDIREYGDGNVTVKLVLRGFVYLNHNIILDLFPKSKVNLSPQLKKLTSIFPDIPPFSIYVMNPTEILAEKVNTLFNRQKSQDLHDINFLLGLTSIDWQLLSEKLDTDGLTFSQDELNRKIIDIEPIWKKELLDLVPNVPSFNEVAMNVLTAFREENASFFIKELEMAIIQ